MPPGAVPSTRRLESRQFRIIDLQNPVWRDDHQHRPVDVVAEPLEDLTRVALNARRAHREEPAVDGGDSRAQQREASIYTGVYGGRGAGSMLARHQSTAGIVGSVRVLTGSRSNR